LLSLLEAGFIITGWLTHKLGSGTVWFFSPRFKSYS